MDEQELKKENEILRREKAFIEESKMMDTAFYKSDVRVLEDTIKSLRVFRRNLAWFFVGSLCANGVFLWMIFGGR